MCREFVCAAVPAPTVPAANMCLLKFPIEDGRTTVRKEEGGGPPPPDEGNDALAASPKKSVSAPSVVSFAAIGDSCGSSLLLNIGRKLPPCPPLGPVLANPLRTLVSRRGSFFFPTPHREIRPVKYRGAFTLRSVWLTLAVPTFASRPTRGKEKRSYQSALTMSSGHFLDRTIGN